MKIEAVTLVDIDKSVLSQSRNTVDGQVTEPQRRREEKPAKAAVQHLDLARYVERAHRRYLDVLRAELARLGIDDVSPAQVLMMFTIGEGEMSVRDLLERGNYLGSNASYNLKRLLEAGYIEREASSRDRRSAHISLAPRGHELCAKIREIDQSYQQLLVRDSEQLRDIETTVKTLRRVEMMILTTIKYGDSPKAWGDD
jgi:DNA-binding MarR family transcriptional regulator